VKELAAHVWNGLDRLPTYLAAPAPPAATADAVSYWRSSGPGADAPSVAARSAEIAERFADGAELARSFHEHWPACIEAARADDPSRLVRSRVADIRLDEFVATRVVEAAVHGLDVAAAVRREPWITPAATEVTVTILRALLGSDPPARWDDVAFVEIGTGRRTPGDRELAELGSASSLLPLLA
jgi:hypothetical protein